MQTAYVVSPYMAQDEDLSAAERAIVQRNCVAFRRELAEALGAEITQQDIATMSNLSLDTIRGYEQGRRTPDLGPLRAMAAIYGRAVEDFFAENPPPPDASKRRGYALKVVGKPPAGMMEEIAKIREKYTHEEAARRHEQKKGMLKPPPRKKP